MKFKAFILSFCILGILGCTAPDYEDRLSSIGQQLLLIDSIPPADYTNTNHVIKDVVWVGPSLFQAINTDFDKTNCKVVTKKGYFIDGGITKSNYFILLETQEKRINIRLRYDKKRDKFHIVNFYSRIENNG